MATAPILTRGPGAYRPSAAAGPETVRRGTLVARRPLGGVVGDAEAVAVPATACPPRRARHSPALPAAAPNCLRVRPKTPPTATGSQPHCAHSMMGLASSPRHHLRPSTAHYDAPRFWRGHERGLISPCASLAVPAKGCKPAGCCAGLICWAYALRTGQRRGRRGLYAADGAAARRTGLLRCGRGGGAADGAYMRQTGLLRGRRGSCTMSGAVARRKGLSRGGLGCCAADGAYAWRRGLLRSGRGLSAADGAAAI